MLKHNLVKIARQGDYVKFIFFVLLCGGLLLIQKQHHYSFVYLDILAQPIRNIPHTFFYWYDKFAQINIALQQDGQQKLENRIAYLENANTLLISQVHELSILKQQNAELLELLEVKSSVANFTSKLAEVKRVSNAYSLHEISINLNASDGVKVGQAVINSRGVVGRVSRVGVYDSNVVLLNAPSMSISVYSKRNGLRAIAYGSSDGLRLKSPDKRLSIESEDVFVTTGLGGIFPVGLPVARVTAVEKDRYMIRSRLQPIVASLGLRRVLVLISK